MFPNRGDVSVNGSALRGARGFAILAQQDLTAREREVWALVAVGWNDAEIAERLMVNCLTVRVHVSNLLVKLGVGNRQEAVRLARQRGLTAGAVGRQRPTGEVQSAIL